MEVVPLGAKSHKLSKAQDFKRNWKDINQHIYDIKKRKQPYKDHKQTEYD